MVTVGCGCCEVVVCWSTVSWWPRPSSPSPPTLTRSEPLASRPLCLHGLAVACPLCLHGLAVACPLCLHGLAVACPLCLHGLAVACLLCLHGLAVACPLCLHGLAVACLLCLHGLAVACLLCLHGLAVACPLCRASSSMLLDCRPRQETTWSRAECWHLCSAGCGDWLCLPQGTLWRLFTASCR